MKTFLESVKKENAPKLPKGIPTFEEAIKQSSIEEAFTGKDPVSKSFEVLHALQLELQTLEKSLLSMRGQYLSFEKDSENRKRLEPKMVELSKKKKDIEKKIHDAEIASQRALANDDTELEDLDIF